MGSIRPEPPRPQDHLSSQVSACAAVRSTRLFLSAGSSQEGCLTTATYKQPVRPGVGLDDATSVRFFRAAKERYKVLRTANLTRGSFYMTTNPIPPRVASYLVGIQRRGSWEQGLLFLIGSSCFWHREKEFGIKAYRRLGSLSPCGGMYRSALGACHYFGSRAFSGQRCIQPRVQ